MELGNISPISNEKISGHVGKMYDLIFPVNAVTVTLIRKPTTEGGNYGEEDSDPEIHYTIQLNINPVLTKPFNIGKQNDLARDYSHRIMSNAKLYPEYGKGVDGDIIEVPLLEIIQTDQIIHDGIKYELSEQFENTKINGQDLMWQVCYGKVLTDE